MTNRFALRSILICTAAYLHICTSLPAQTSEGPLNAGSAANTSCPFSYSSTVDYLPAANASASDDVYATASHCDCCDQNTRCFETTNFGFSIPLTATIDGIVVEVEKHATANSMVQDNGVRIIRNGATTGIDHMTSANWPAVDAWSTYGTPTDLWGTSWTPADINASNFGVALASISYTCNGNGGAMTSYIDNVRITVYYTDVSTGISAAASNDGTIGIFPNPASGAVTLTIAPAENVATVNCYDVTGKLVFSVSKQGNGGKIELEETSGLEAGIYFVEVVCGEMRSIAKMIIE